MSGSPFQIDPKYTHRVIEAHEIYSSQLFEERTIKVYLPPSYNANQTYPILYCHDGNEFFSHGRVATIANQLIGEGLLQPLIIVGIAVHHSRRTEDYAPDGERHEAYSRFVLDTCIPFVEESYPVDEKKRFMAGISLGAVVSLELHLRAPDLLPRLLLFSGAYYPTVIEDVAKQSDLKGLSAYMVVGRQETAVKTHHGDYDFYHLNQTMRDMLNLRGAKIDYSEAEGTHIWGFWQQQLPASLLWLNGLVSGNKP